MIKPYRFLKLAPVICFLILTGCVSGVAHSMPAVLESGDAETITMLKSALADAMNTKTVELGAGDPTVASTIAVLPPRLSTNEDRSLARPVLFDLELRGQACFAVRRDTGAAYALGVRCKALGG